MELDQFSIQTSRLKLSGYKNNVTQGSPIIALHGWLDNAASFVPLAEHMDVARPFYALEMPGHGLSEHRPKGANYHLIDNVVDVVVFIQTVLNMMTDKNEGYDEGALPSGADIGTVSLIGHSLGGIVCSLVAAAAPNLVDKLILLDSLGPYTDQNDNVLPQLRKSVAKYSSLAARKLTVFPDKKSAAKVRMTGVGKVSHQSAMLLVERGLEKVEGGYQWCSDPQLLNPSLIRFSEEQIKAIFEGIVCPVSLICGDQGYFSNYKDLTKRFSYIKHLQNTNVSGGHHFHMDGDVSKTMELINEFLAL